MSYSSDSDSYDGGDSPCSDCDMGALDDLKCEAEGIAKRAELMKQEAGKLEERRKKYDEARKSYAKARSAAEPEVKALKEQIDKLLDQLKCVINHERTITCLTDAHKTVQERIKKCGRKVGCCIDDDCEFDTRQPEGKPAEVLKELYSRQADIKRRTERAEWCFDSLIDEPKNLGDRVKRIREELGKIATEMGGDPKTVDFKRLYTRALVAQWDLTYLWLGFKDVNAYVDCLCRGLMCSLKGRKALAVIGSLIAVLECKDKEKEVRCKWLQDNTVEEVLAEYLRICPPKENEGGGEEYGSSSAI